VTDEYKSWISYVAEHLDEVETEASGNAELAEFTVCRLKTEPLILSDNLVEPCCKCFRLVQLRPNAPKRPKRICDECIKPIIAAGRKKGEEVRMVITENTRDDVARFLRKKRFS
jgi:hypothetical protein